MPPQECNHVIYFQKVYTQRSLTSFPDTSSYSPSSILGSQYFIVFWVFLSVFLLPQINRFICVLISSIGASLVAQIVKSLPAIQETYVWSLGWRDSLEKGMEIHSSILAFENSVGRGYSPWDRRVRGNWVTNTFTFVSSCLHKRLDIRNTLSIRFFFLTLHLLE